jgi:hypothetical protein
LCKKSLFFIFEAFELLKRLSHGRSPRTFTSLGEGGGMAASEFSPVARMMLYRVLAGGKGEGLPTVLGDEVQKTL